MRILFVNVGEIRDYLLTGGILLVAFFLILARQDDAFQNIRKASIWVISTIEKPLANVRIYRTAISTNSSLQQQNILLQDEVNRLRTLRDENESLRSLLGLMNTIEYELLPTIIINKNLTGINNFMIVNVGNRDGVQPGMPLINADGLLGIVSHVGSRNSTVIPFYNRQFRVSARVEDSRAFGIVSWESPRMDELTLNFVPQTVEVNPGERVFTSGASNQLPPYIPIGIVERTEPDPGKETQRIFVQPFANLSTAVEAHVMLFYPEAEVDSLISRLIVR